MFPLCLCEEGLQTVSFGSIYEIEIDPVCLLFFISHFIWFSCQKSPRTPPRMVKWSIKSGLLSGRTHRRSAETDDHRGEDRQMTQPDRQYLQAGDIRKYFLGSLLSGEDPVRHQCTVCLGGYVRFLSIRSPADPSGDPADLWYRCSAWS